MRTFLLLASGCALVLGLAFLLSHLLTEPVSISEAPSSGEAIAEKPPVPTLPSTAPQANTETPLPEASAEQIEPQVAEAPSSVFLGSSRELDYAEELLASPNADTDKLKSATDVFRICLQQEPGHARCQDNLRRAKERLRTTGEKLLEQHMRAKEAQHRIVIDKQNMMVPKLEAPAP